MGCWAEGPFGNDAALDWVGDVVDAMMKPIDEFLADPQIDETFDQAFAAVALLNEVMEVTPTRPWRGDDAIDGEPIRDAMLACYDDSIDELDPDPDYKREQRRLLVAALDRFVGFLDQQ